MVRSGCLNPDGTKRWVLPLSGINTTNTAITYASPAIGPNGTIYFGSGSGQVCAVNANGGPKWTFTSGGISASPALGSDGTIFVGSYGTPSYLYALSPWGTNLWKFETPAYVFSSPPIGPDGTVYFGAGTNLYALYGTNGLMSSSCPMFRGNVKHTARSIQRALMPPQLGADGRLTMNVNVETARTYHVEYSTNLLDWAELTLLVSQTFTTVIDTMTNASHKSYRLSTALP